MKEATFLQRACRYFWVSNETKKEVIVSLLSDGRFMTGLDLVRESKGFLKRGIVYITLHEMEKEGVLQWELIADGRRLYSLRESSQSCSDCENDMCDEIGTCIAEIHRSAEEEQCAYIAKGVCRDCGACSIEEAHGKCRPQSSVSGGYYCGGEDLWEESL